MMMFRAVMMMMIRIVTCDDDDVITIISLTPVTKTVLTRVRGDDDDVLDKDCHVGDYG